MAEADGAQLEFRVAAFLGDDPVAKADIREKEMYTGFPLQSSTTAIKLKLLQRRDKTRKNTHSSPCMGASLAPETKLDIMTSFVRSIKALPKHRRTGLKR